MAALKWLDPVLAI